MLIVDLDIDNFSSYFLRLDIFESDFFGTFGLGIMVYPPETIDVEEVFVNFDEKVEDSPYVLIMNGVLLGALAVGTIIMRRLGQEDERVVNL